MGPYRSCSESAAVHPAVSPVGNDSCCFVDRLLPPSSVTLVVLRFFLDEPLSPLNLSLETIFLAIIVQT